MPSALRAALDFASLPERHRYGSHRQQRAELWLPSAGEPPFPVAVVIHGGYWQATYGKLIMRALCGDLVRRGVAAWNIEYRRLGRGQGGGWPATFDDVAAAIDGLARVASGRVRLDDVRALGHSAGGHLALWAAARGGFTRVAAQAPVTNLVAAGAVARQLMGGSSDDLPDRWAGADPIRMLPLGVPVRIVHTPEDATVPVARSREYAEAARAAGDPVELVDSVHGGHRVHLDPRSAAWEAAAEFLAG